jgi:hypothetical protein
VRRVHLQLQMAAVFPACECTQAAAHLGSLVGKMWVPAKMLPLLDIAVCYLQGQRAAVMAAAAVRR